MFIVSTYNKTTGEIESKEAFYFFEFANQERKHREKIYSSQPGKYSVRIDEYYNGERQNIFSL